MNEIEKLEKSIEDFKKLHKENPEAGSYVLGVLENYISSLQRRLEDMKTGYKIAVREKNE
jgi:hypothetical protein